MPSNREYNRSMWPSTVTLGLGAADALHSIHTLGKYAALVLCHTLRSGERWQVEWSSLPFYRTAVTDLGRNKHYEKKQLPGGKIPHSHKLSTITTLCAQPRTIGTITLTAISTAPDAVKYLYQLWGRKMIQNYWEQ